MTFRNSREARLAQADAARKNRGLTTASLLWEACCHGDRLQLVSSKRMMAVLRELPDRTDPKVLVLRIDTISNLQSRATMWFCLIRQITLCERLTQYCLHLRIVFGHCLRQSGLFDRLLSLLLCQHLL